MPRLRAAVRRAPCRGPPWAREGRAQPRGATPGGATPPARRCPAPAASPGQPSWQPARLPGACAAGPAQEPSAPACLGRQGPHLSCGRLSSTTLWSCALLGLAHCGTPAGLSAAQARAAACLQGPPGTRKAGSLCKRVSRARARAGSPAATGQRLPAPGAGQSAAWLLATRNSGRRRAARAASASHHALRQHVARINRPGLASTGCCACCARLQNQRELEACLCQGCKS